MIFMAAYSPQVVNCWARSESTETHLQELYRSDALLPDKTENLKPRPPEPHDLYNLLFPREVNSWVGSENIETNMQSTSVPQFCPYQCSVPLPIL
jgi:hypothetical protein